MEPKNRLSEIFADLGLAEVRVSKEQLDKWGMTPNRFNQLVANRARVGMTVGEAQALREWSGSRKTSRAATPASSTRR